MDNQISMCGCELNLDLCNCNLPYIYINGEKENS